MKFLDVKTDFAFKKVFGSEESKERLISFLNAVIKFEHHALIKDVTIVDPYNIPQLLGMKDTYVDVKAILDNNTKVIIEMQVLNHPGLEKRILYNAAKNYSTQLLEGEQYHLLNPIIALTIVDFIMFEDSDQVISNFKLIEKENFINYSDDLEMIFIELPKFTHELDELSNITEQWIYFIKNAGSLNYIPDNFPPAINSAFETSNTALLTPEELELQYKKKEFISIQKSSLILARETGKAEGLAEGKAEGLAEGEARGKAEGLAEGLAEGRAEERKAFIIKMYRSGLSLDQICSLSDLSQDQVQQVIAG